MTDASILVRALRDPASVTALDAAGWTALLAIARAEQLIGSLAHRLDGLPMPGAARRLLADARASAEQGRVAALWEAEMARRALAPLAMPVVLLKGTAFVAAGLAAGPGSTKRKPRCSPPAGNGSSPTLMTIPITVAGCTSCLR